MSKENIERIQVLASMRDPEIDAFLKEYVKEGFKQYLSREKKKREKELLQLFNQILNQCSELLSEPKADCKPDIAFNLLNWEFVSGKYFKIFKATEQNNSLRLAHAVFVWLYSFLTLINATLKHRYKISCRLAFYIEGEAIIRDNEQGGIV